MEREENYRKLRVLGSVAKAAAALRETSHLYQAGFWLGAVSRSYAAVFHSAAAALYSRRFDIIKPSALVSSFNHELIKPGFIDRQYLRLMIDSYECYQAAEYGFEVKPDADAARQMAEQAAQFHHGVVNYLRGKGWLASVEKGRI